MVLGRDLGIRPLGLGEVVDRSVALTRRHFRALFLAMLVMEAPALALARVESLRFSDALGAFTHPGNASAILAPLVTSFALILVAFLFLQSVATAVATLIVAPSLDPREKPRHSRIQQAFSILVACALETLVLLLAPALAMIPGLLVLTHTTNTSGLVGGILLASVLPVIAMVISFVRLLLTPAAAAAELRGPSALFRSSRLMKPSGARSFVERPSVRASLVLFATFVLVLAVNALAGVPRALVSRLGAGPSRLASPFGLLPLPVELSLSAFEAVAGAALQPFSLVAVAVLYFERRARTEGLDLEIWAEHLQKGP